MPRIYVDFGGLQELQNKMSRILDEVNDLGDEIARSANRLDWEVSQKRSIDEQIHRARRKAARLAQKAEQMQRFLVRANSEFSRTDHKCAKEQQKITCNLESVWKCFLGFSSRTFGEIGQYGAEVLEALKKAGYYFLNGAIDFKKAHLGAINTAIGFGSVGVAPIAPIVVSGALRERIGAVCGGGSSGGTTRNKKETTNLTITIKNNQPTGATTGRTSIEDVRNIDLSSVPSQIWGGMTCQGLKPYKQTATAVVTCSGVAAIHPMASVGQIVIGAGVAWWENDWGTTLARGTSPSTAITLADFMQYISKIK